MHRPDALSGTEPWLWSPGAGQDVWAMFMACRAGDLAEVKRLVENDPSLIRSHYEYRTPLAFAVNANQLAVAEFLLDHGAASVGLGDPFEAARDRGYLDMEKLLARKFAALHDASAAGEPVAEAIRAYDAARVRELLDQSPGLVNAGDRTSNKPIHWATMTRQIPLIDDLLERGADIEAQRIDGARAIHLTNGDYTYRGWRDVPSHVATKPDEVYRHLVARGANVDVWMASVKGDLDRVRELIDADSSLVNANNPYNSYYAGCGCPLKNAAAAGHMEIVRLLLDRGADPSLPAEGIAPNGHALYSAVYHGHYDIAKLLLEQGANPNAPAESSGDPVWLAIRDQDLRMIELLASHGARWEIPIDPSGALTYERIIATGLQRSAEVLAYFGDVEAGMALFESDPKLADDAEALEAAAGRGHDDFVRLMLDYQPGLVKKVMVPRPRGMAESLFERGMDPNRPRWTGRRPLHAFAGDGDIESAELYLDHGADIDLRDDEDFATPLAVAARAGRKEMVQFLLSRGAKKRLPGDPEWATPAAWARRRGHEDIARILVQ